MAEKTFKELIEDAASTLEYHVEGAILEFTEAVVERMQNLEMTKKRLADQMGCSAPHVSQMLDGTTNFTLESMVKVARALDSELKITLQPIGQVNVSPMSRIYHTLRSYLVHTDWAGGTASADDEEIEPEWRTVTRERFDFENVWCVSARTAVESAE